MLVVGENLWMNAFQGVIGENPERKTDQKL
jgi:hypothetical protein